jgi:hypothetical protein
VVTSVHSFVFAGEGHKGLNMVGDTMSCLSAMR